MRKALLAALAAPLAFIGFSAPAHAYPWSYYGYSSPYSSYSMISGPGGYSGYGWGTRNMYSYSDNYGTTTCFSAGNMVICN